MFGMDRFADYVALAVAVHGVALVVVNITPTPKDNEALSNAARLAVKGYRAIEILAGIVSSRVKR
jgi:heme exporter protein D